MFQFKYYIMKIPYPLKSGCAISSSSFSLAFAVSFGVSFGISFGPPLGESSTATFFSLGGIFSSFDLAKAVLL